MKQMMKASGCSNSGNQYAWFRAEFPANAEIQIYADDFYELWNNGKFLAYGPARSGEPLLYFDRFQLSGSRNHVTVKVHGRKRVPELLRIGAPNVPMLTTPMLRIPSAMPVSPNFAIWMSKKRTMYLPLSMIRTGFLPSKAGSFRLPIFCRALFRFFGKPNASRCA